MIGVSAYLNRINFHGSTKPTLETLRGIHREWEGICRLHAVGGCIRMTDDDLAALYIYLTTAP